MASFVNTFMSHTIFCILTSSTHKSFLDSDLLHLARSRCVKATLASGTTTACYFATIHTESTQVSNLWRHLFPSRLHEPSLQIVRFSVRCALLWVNEHGWGKSAWTGIAQTSMGETIFTDTEHTSYLSFFVRLRTFWPANCTPEKCVNLRQKMHCNKTA